MQKTILALCDSDSEYIQLLGQYLRQQSNLWEIHTYFGLSEFEKEAENVAFLAIAESTYDEKVFSFPGEKTIVLCESGLMQWEKVTYVDKYQPADGIFRELMRFHIEHIAQGPIATIGQFHNTRFLGFYSPIHRCGQTTLALAVGQYLSCRHPTLYLNMESCVGFGELLPNYQCKDLADVMYYLRTDPGRFSLRMKTLVQRVEELFFLPPIRAGQNLLDITADDWMQLFAQIEMAGEYEYVVLDLGEMIQGLTEVLRLCSAVYTPVSRDGMGREKRNLYETVLQKSGGEDILRKTLWLDIPRMPPPRTFRELLTAERTAYVRKILMGIED